MGTIQKVSFKDTLKSVDTEETLDIYFYRPVGYAWSLLFMRLGITPNPVTIAGIFIGVAGGVLFYFNDLKINIIGMLLMVIANSLDSADGQLARMTNNKTRLGRILDGLCGNIWFIVIYCALCLRLQNDGFRVWIWLLAVAASVCHIQQAAMADYYRNIHLLFLKGKTGSEVDNYDTLTIEFNQLSWKRDFWRKIILMFYRNYTRQQEALSKNLQKFLKKVRSVYGDNLPEWLKTEFREKDKPLMKYTNILTFNTRIIVLFISLFLNKVWIYFVFELTVLNALLVYMIYCQEQISRYFYNKIETGQREEK
ncbi:MAG: CDP-alcohol phosphatidyltransferase family protein [Prevotellaceae bacterium]|jgi:phosphatidylglycerophosphate synthase|nr:CDP-alcohol phosphatidyltransferase family protein [Prevotellaceae bacterium]